MHDLIVVGAGTAGCVLAEGLTRSGKLRVLLIEAGPEPKNQFVAIPAGFTKLYRSELDWDFESEPQTFAGGRRIFTPRGKMLGGSSNMNAQMHQWCHPADFDGWAESGADGWGWSNVADIFKAQERWLGDDGDAERGRSGPMVISPNRNARRITHLFVQAARNAGLGDAPRYNGSAYQGAWIAELAHKAGRRFSAHDAFLKPAMRRPNLEVITDTHVTRVVMEGNRATGVALLRDGVEQTLPCRGVALAAGAFNSPQLLMLSGIGPEKTLRDFGIPVQFNAPEVGKNLQDHPVVGMTFNTFGTDTLKSAESPFNVARYLLFKSGMLASNGVEGFAFTQIHPGSVAAPDLELMFLPGEATKDFLEPPEVHAFVIAPAVVAPRSRGSLALRSNDPFDPVSIDFGLLSDSEGVDAKVLLAGLRLARKIASTEPLLAHNAGELRPGSAAVSDEELLSHVAEYIQTVYHPTSTCRMGVDASSVTTPDLRVRGVDGLWVADASVMPSVPRGHPNAVVAMIADRAAGWISAEIH